MILFTIIGALIGAGFASGQEIYFFFYRFGVNGIYGIIICNIIMSVSIYKTLKIIYENNINSYKEFLDIIFQNRKKFSNISNALVNVFLAVTFFIMVSGFGAYLSQALKINSIIGSMILAFISYVFFIKNIDNLTKINDIIIPLLIIIVAIIGIKNVFNIDFTKISLNKENNINWLIQAFLYAGYNLILVQPVLVGLKKFLKSKRYIFNVAILSFFIMLILTILEFLLLTNIGDFNGLEMPLVFVIQSKYSDFNFIYGIIILIAIFSTAVSVGIGLLNNICKNTKSYPQIAKILCITSVIISPIGFSNMVNNLFPLFGFLGLFLQITY